METKKRCLLRSEPFNIYSTAKTINFLPEQNIISAYFKNEGTTNVLLYGGLITITPNNFYSLGNNNYTGFVRNDVIDFEFSGSGNNKLIVIIDKIV